jgi:hypothetical protein
VTFTSARNAAAVDLAHLLPCHTHPPTYLHGACLLLAEPGQAAVHNGPRVGLELLHQHVQLGSGLSALLRNPLTARQPRELLLAAHPHLVVSTQFQEHQSYKRAAQEMQQQ